MFRLLGLAFIAWTIVAIAGCHHSNEAVNEKPMPPSLGGFDISVAMREAFGNVDSKLHSHARIPASPAVDLAGSGFAIDDELQVIPFQAYRTTQNGKQAIFLLTYAILDSVDDFSCHACVPLIGVATFEKTEGIWRRSAANPFVTRMGAWGKPPAQIRLIKIGKSHEAIQITHEDGNQGYMGTWTTLLIPVNGDVKEVFSAQIAADDKGACGPGPEDEIPCYSSKMSLRFVRGNNPDYDDIELRLSGTDRVPGKPYRKHSVSGFQRLAFKDTRYITIEKQGDQTSDGTGEDDHTK